MNVAALSSNTSKHAYKVNTCTFVHHFRQDDDEIFHVLRHLFVVISERAGEDDCFSYFLSVLEREGGHVNYERRCKIGNSTAQLCY